MNRNTVASGARVLTGFVLACAAAILVLPSGSAEAGSKRKAKAIVPTVSAVPLDADPVVDGAMDKVWRKVRPVTVGPCLGGVMASPLQRAASEGVSVRMRMGYTEDRIYVLTEWPDAAESLERNFVLGSDGNWTKAGSDEGYYGTGNEDRFNLMWEIGDVTYFKHWGCVVMCHLGTDGVGTRMATSVTGEKCDLWHWKAQRSNPVGQADDQVVRDKTTGYPTSHGRRDDAKPSGSGATSNDDGTGRPKYVWTGSRGAEDEMDPPFEPADRRILLDGDKALVADYNRFVPGDVVPREILRPFLGSHGDITAKGVWAKGKWTLEMSRLLVTGNDDDVPFDDLTKTYHLGLSLHDNSGDPGHSEYFLLKVVFVP